jgi:hypothetical protein
MEKVKEFAKKHKYKLIGAGAAIAGLAAVACGVKPLRNPNLWEEIVPWNTTDRTGFVRRWNGDDKYKGCVAIGLRGVTVAELTEAAAEAFGKASLGEDTVIEQVILTTVKEAK